MKFAASAVAALNVLPLTLATPVGSESKLVQRLPEPESEFTKRAEAVFEYDVRSLEQEFGTQGLEKRRGGGGGGRSGGGSSSSGSSGGSSSGGSRGGSSSSGGSGATGGSRGTTSATPSYGGGKYYGGGSSSSFPAGNRSPGRNIAPYALGGAALGFAAFALWPRPVYVYPWTTPFYYHNRTNNTNHNQARDDTNNNGTVTLPVTCLCDQQMPCSCDDNGNSTYLDAFFGPNNQTLQPLVATIQNVNGTDKVVLNGTLPDDGSDDDTSAGNILRLQSSGYAMMSAGFVASLWLL